MRDYAEHGKHPGPLPSPVSSPGTTPSTPRRCCPTVRRRSPRSRACSRPAARCAPRAAEAENIEGIERQLGVGVAEAPETAGRSDARPSTAPAPGQSSTTGEERS
ncbi:MAG: hypothetical protein R2731_17445 [Nocardioides sp.]